MSDPDPAYPDSWYAASVPERPAEAPLAGDVQCDVCVVGGGITGLSTALHLAQMGYDVVLLEAARVGWGASGRSGGQVIFGYACDQSRLEALVGFDDARAHWQIACDAVALTRRLIREHEIDCDATDGMVHVAIKPRQRDELKAWQRELEQRYDYRSLTFLDAGALADEVDSPRYIAGLRDDQSLHLHPLKYTLGLARAARKAGVRVYEHSRARGLDAGGRKTVFTDNGSVHCRSIALCGNAYLDRLTRRLHRRIMPVGTYIVATQPLGETVARSLIPSHAAVSDINFVLDYFRCSADHRMLFGGRVSYSRMAPPNLAASIGKRMTRVFPRLADTRIDYAWGGYVGITMNRAPDIGRVAPDVAYAQGFSGHGMAMTAMAGQVLAEAIAGTHERMDLFARIPHRDFPGGALLRTPALVLAMAWYRLRDWL